MASMNTIYLLTNKVNGKQYVGKTQKAPEDRWKEHQFSSIAGGGQLFHQAVFEHGPSAFTLTILEQDVPDEIALEAEGRWILRMGCRAPAGYNKTEGRQLVPTRRPTGFRMRPEMYEALRDAAHLDRRTMQDIMDEALDNWLAARK